MSNKLILDLTVRLTQALDQNYDVVNMDTVLAVISALEGATITKEQLETTRLAKHINQLRRRNKSNILAIRAKNLLKKWREMFGITSQAQSESVLSVTQQAAPTQQPVPKPPLSSTSQPASPYTNSQLLSENFDNSLSSIGVDLSRTTTTLATGSISNTGSVNFTFNKKSVATVTTAADAAIGSRSNGALVKTTNRTITNNSSPATTAASKVKHPTSFKNLITGFNVNNVPTKENPSAFSSKVPPRIAVNETKLFIIDDDDNQSQPSASSGANKTALAGVSSLRTHKSTKRKDRNSPVVMTFVENSSSPITFENVCHEQTRTGRIMAHPSIRNNSSQIITSTIDLHDSNSSSNFADATEVVTTSITNSGTIGGRATVGISSNSSNKRIRKDKKRSSERVELVTEPEHFQPTIDESSRIAFPISGIQDYLSLSNSSMSIFPAGTGGGVGDASGGGDGTEIFSATANEEYQPPDSSTDKPDGDLTFAGKFKQNSGGSIDVGSSSSYYKGGGERGENMSAGDLKAAINNSRDSVSAGGGTGSTSAFLPFSRNLNESSSNSRTSQLDLIDVVNQDSLSIITVDDLRQYQQKQSFNEKRKEPILESATAVAQSQTKLPKNIINTLKQQYSSKESTKPCGTASQRSINASSKPSTPTSVLPIIANAVSSPPVEQKVPKKRGRKKGSKGVDSVLAQSSGLSAQFLMGTALGSNKKVKTTRELLIDIQSRKMGSATSSPTLMNWFATSRPASSCSEPSLHSPRTSDANSTNATMSTAARSTPEKNASNNSIAADELYESDSDSNTSEPSHDSVKLPILNGIKKLKDITESSTAPAFSIEEQIKELMALLPEVDTKKIDWVAYENFPCSCTLREIPPEVQVAVAATKNDGNALDLLKTVDPIKNEDDEEPVISVSVVPIEQQKLPPRSRSPSVLPHHSQSAPVSAVTSPVEPPINKPMKSIFDLDFDDENDPLHMFVEAASKTKNGIISHQEDESSNKIEHATQNKGHSFKSIQSEFEPQNRQQIPITQQPPIAVLHLPTAQPVPEPTDSMMPLHSNFPTYEAVEDPACKAKQRFEVQTNQITKFHIHAFHNCFIPNVNGNWDQSIPQNDVDNENLQTVNRCLHSNVVPKYGCLVRERIPKDLSHIKFTYNYKPNTTIKSDKPTLPFLGVANIHRRQHFRLHHYHRKQKKMAAKEKRKEKKLKLSTTNEVEETKVDALLQINEIKSDFCNKTKCIIEKNPVVDIEVDKYKIKSEPVKNTANPLTIFSNNLEDSPKPNVKTSKKLITPSSRVYSKADSSLVNDQTQSQINEKKPFIINGNVPHLINNNTIIKSDDNLSCTKLLNDTHSMPYIDVTDLERVAASRRSSSCSNSSLKQNQKSINLKLRRHRLEQRQLEKERQQLKRKHLASLTDVFEFNVDDSVEQPKVPSLVKRIKIVNGSYAASRRLTNSMTDSSCLDDDGDSDCFHVHSENDIITEEEDDQPADDDDDDDDLEEIPDDYDEEDGDDEEEVEEDCRDFHEVVTHDIKSSTTGNKHIVLTIKKTPSKTNSPSSSSMSPAPPLIQNATTKLSSIYLPTIQLTVDPLLGDQSFEVKSQQESKNLESLELNKINAVDFISKTDFFLPKTTDIAIYNFQLKKNGDNDHANGPDNENAELIPIVIDENADHQEEENAESEVIITEEGTKDDDKQKEVPPKKELVTKAELFDSIQLTKKHLRRIELKNRLREGIEQAQKLHRQLFFPYELHTSIGSKILEINSCTSDCTDPSDDDTTSDSDTEHTTSSSSGNGNLKSRNMLKRRRKMKLPPGKRRVAGAGNLPSSSSSSSSSDSSSSASAFTSWTTSSDDDDNRKRKPIPNVEVKQDESEISNEKDQKRSQTQEPELPLGNNFLLRSFNHIYVSTEERQRQQHLEQISEYRQHLEVFNRGYITLSGDEDETPSAVALQSRDSSSGYHNLYDVNPRYNVYENQSLADRSGMASQYTDMKEPSEERPHTIQTTTIEDTSVDIETVELLSAAGVAEPSTVIMSEIDIEVEVVEPAMGEASKLTTSSDCNYRINPDRSIGSSNINNNNHYNRSVQLNDEQLNVAAAAAAAEDENYLVAQEEYRTGMRRVDEDVDDEDGNNCARTQQFKEWHEVLQLRSYNDELLTVLPYVVIE